MNKKLYQCLLHAITAHALRLMTIEQKTAAEMR